MSITQMVQNLALSGVLGYISLTYLQDKGAVTKYLSATDANMKRILFGLAYYWVYSMLLALIHTYEIVDPALSIISLTGTVVIATVLTLLYKRWLLRHSTNDEGFATRTTRERAFDNPAGGDVLAHVFREDGSYVGSGLICDVNLEAQAGRDFSMLSLPDGYHACDDRKKAAATSQLYYVDVESGLEFYLTYYSKETAKVDGPE